MFLFVFHWYLPSFPGTVAYISYLLSFGKANNLEVPSCFLWPSFWCIRWFGGPENSSFQENGLNFCNLRSVLKAWEVQCFFEWLPVPWDCACCFQGWYNCLHYVACWVYCAQFCFFLYVSVVSSSLAFCLIVAYNLFLGFCSRVCWLSWIVVSVSVRLHSDLLSFWLHFLLQLSSVLLFVG